MFSRKRAKVYCLVAFAAIFVVAMLAKQGSTGLVHAYAEGPPGGFAGAPGEQNCTACHNSFAVNSGTGTVTINTPSSYQPGQTYQITVQDQTSDQSRRRWGFQLTVLTSNNAKAGQLQATSITALLTGEGPGFNRDYIEHVRDGTFQGQTGGASWTFPWVAPSSDVGPVTFYLATNMANGDGTNQGDFIFTQSKTIPAAGASTSGPPVITSIDIQGKKMFVTGSSFDDGATMFINDQKTKTRNDDTTPTTLLICKKGGKLIDPGTTVNLQVKNSDGTPSAVFVYTRPST